MVMVTVFISHGTPMRRPWEVRLSRAFVLAGTVDKTERIACFVDGFNLYQETDVNVGLWMLNEAHKGSFDHAFLLSNDSDLAPVVAMLKTELAASATSTRACSTTPPSAHATRS